MGKMQLCIRINIRILPAAGHRLLKTTVPCSETATKTGISVIL